MSTITPTVGRKVWFYDEDADRDLREMQRHDDTTPMDATVIYVWSPTCVNLSITDHAGRIHMRGRVTLRAPAEGDCHGKERVATWMPYQMGQAAKAAERAS